MARKSTKPNKIVVRVFGTAEIRVGNRTIGLGTEALFALALYLTTRAGERVSRDELLEMFWPDGTIEARRHAMRQMMYRLRKEGIEPEVEGNGCTLDPLLVDSDLRDCLHHDWPQHATLEGIVGASGRMPTFSPRVPEPFHEWHEEVRTERERQVGKASVRILQEARRRGAWAEVDQCARLILNSDPLNEEATLASAEAAVVGGLKGRALEILDQFIEEISPLNPTAARPAALMRKRIAERRAQWAQQPTAEVPLVGRSEVLALIGESIDPSSPSPGKTLLIVGPSGFGKTRLLAEASDLVALRGGRLLSVRAEPSLAAHPLSTARDLVRRLLELPGAAAVPPVAMEIARTLVRETSLETSPFGFSAARPIDDVGRCISELISAVSHETRLTLLIDDLQNLDDHSLAAVSSVILALKGDRCSVLLAGRSSVLSRIHMPPDSRWGRVIRLTPLSQEETTVLASATAAACHRRLSGEELSRIVDSSAGHPLFARELAMRRSKGASDDRLPHTLADLVARDLASQDSDSLTVLRIVALLGDAATVSRVQQAARLDRERLIASIEGLSLDGILQTSHERALRLHDSWRSAVLEGIPGPTAALLALGCAEVLEADQSSQDFTSQRRTAELLELAGEYEKAASYRVASIDSLIATGLYSPAIDSANHALLHSHKPSTSARLRLRQALGHLGSGRPHLALPESESVWRSRLLATDDLMSEHLVALGVSADCRIKTDGADLGPHDQLLSLARSDKLSSNDRARACLWGVRLAANTANLSLLHSYSEALSSIGNNHEQSPQAALARLVISCETGTLDDVGLAIEKLRLVDQKSIPLADLCLLLRCESHAFRLSHRFEEADASGRSAYELAKRHGLAYAARVAAEQMCNTHLDYGSLTGAQYWVSAMLADSSTGPQGTTTTSHEHIRDRLALSMGEPADAAERVRARLPRIRALSNSQSRCTELSLSAAILSLAGDHLEARSLIEASLEIAAPFAGRFAGDFVADSLLRASEACGLREQALGFARSHLAARTRARRLQIPKGFPALLALNGPST